MRGVRLNAAPATYLRGESDGATAVALAAGVSVPPPAGASLRARPLPRPPPAITTKGHRDGKKIPYFVHHDDDLLGFAGLYELRPDCRLPGDHHPEKWSWTFTILTTTAHDMAGHEHDRSPVLILPKRLQAMLARCPIVER